MQAKKEASTEALKDALVEIALGLKELFVLTEQSTEVEQPKHNQGKRGLQQISKKWRLNWAKRWTKRMRRNIAISSDEPIDPIFLSRAAIDLMNCCVFCERKWRTKNIQ